MKIVVCIKQVPDTTAQIKLGTDGKSVNKEDIEYIMSPYDAIAVEHAVLLKEKSDAELIVVSLGSSDVEKSMRTALAMGADRGIHLESDIDSLDSFSVATALAKAIKEEAPDVVFTGIKAIDGDNAQVGMMIANLLDMPFLSTVLELEVTDGVFKGQSEVESGHQSLETPLPCVVSIQKGSVEPRICSLMKIRKARKKEIKKVQPEMVSPSFQVEKVELPPERKGGRIVGEGVEAVGELFKLLREEAKVL